jgi:hypothetical protein
LKLKFIHDATRSCTGLHCAKCERPY